MATTIIRGGGDLASGVALRLHRAGLRVVITELAKPLVVRRSVAFAQAVFESQAAVEGVRARLIGDPAEVEKAWRSGEIPVLIDPAASCRLILKPLILVDGRMTKKPPDLGIDSAPMVIGLGPGFYAGKDCHAVIETQRGHYLGRVIWQGSTEPDTGVPESLGDALLPSDSGAGRRTAYPARVLRSPVSGVLIAHASIGDLLEVGQPVAEVGGKMILAPLRGALRGLLYSGLRVEAGMKIADIDPRADPRYCTLVSDKSLAVAGGVLEAILSRPEIRDRCWESV